MDKTLEDTGDEHYAIERPNVKNCNVLKSKTDVSTNPNAIPIYGVMYGLGYRISYKVEGWMPGNPQRYRATHDCADALLKKTLRHVIDELHEPSLPPVHH